MTVLIGYRPNAEGEAAFRAGLDQAALLGEPMLVVNVSRADALVDPMLLETEQQEELEGRARARGVELTVSHRRGRDATSEVLDLITETDASLVVIGMRRRSPVGKLVLGSTAQQLLLQAPCPVLAVKAGPHG